MQSDGDLSLQPLFSRWCHFSGMMTLISFLMMVCPVLCEQSAISKGSPTPNTLPLTPSAWETRKVQDLCDSWGKFPGRYIGAQLQQISSAAETAREGQHFLTMWGNASRYRGHPTRMSSFILFGNYLIDSRKSHQRTFLKRSDGMLWFASVDCRLGRPTPCSLGQLLDGVIWFLVQRAHLSLHCLDSRPECLAKERLNCVHRGVSFPGTIREGRMTQVSPPSPNKLTEGFLYPMVSLLSFFIKKWRISGLPWGPSA